MTDIVNQATRSRMMSSIRGRDTKPELIVRKYLHHAGLRYRIAPKGLPGRPDIVLPKYSTVVFVHGCFWHRHENCKFAATPKTNVDFWQEKFAANVARDKQVSSQLQNAGWRIVVVWTCQITETELDELVCNIKENI